MKRIIGLIVGLMLWSSPAMAYVKYQNWCQQGGQKVSVSGLNSTTTVQRSFPTCTIAVYTSGTVNLATLYSDTSGTPLGNPFTNQNTTTGQFFFFAANGYYDIQITATGLSPYTLTNIALGNSSSISVNNVMDYGARCDGSTNDQAAFASVALLGGTTVIPGSLSGCVVPATVTFAQSGSLITGQGQGNTGLMAKIITTANPLFDFNSGPSVTISHVGVRDIYIAGSGTGQKIGIRCQDCNDFNAHNIVIDGLQGSSSVGIQVNGRQLVKMDSIAITNTDIPIEYGSNPNSAGNGCDGCILEDVYTVSTDSTQPCVQVDHNSNFTQGEIRHAHFVKCKYGIFYNDDTSSSAVAGLKLSNIRWEQSTATNGCGIYWSRRAGFPQVNLHFEDLYISNTPSNSCGIYLRNANSVTIETSTIPINTGNMVDFDSSVHDVAYTNLTFGNGTISDTSIRKRGCYIQNTTESCFYPNSSNFSFNPGTTNANTQLEPSSSLSLANNAKMCAFSDAVTGVAIVSSSFNTCGFNPNGTTHTDTLLFTPGGGACSNVIGTGGAFNLQYQAGACGSGNACYCLENKTGSMDNFWITIIGKGEH